MKLIRELQTDAGQTFDRLARKLNVSKATISRRVQHLVDSEVIRILMIIDPLALGYDGVAAVGLKCDPDKVEEVAAAVASYRKVTWVSICAGRYDIFAWIILPTLSDLRNFILTELCHLRGLKDIETMLRYKRIKTILRFPLSAVPNKSQPE